jgi:hypothetical protein
VGEPVLAVEKLKIESNPFVPGAGGGRMGRPLQTTFGETIRQIGLETPVVVVSGSAGTGKTLLANMAARACSEMGLTVHRIHRGDLVDGAGERTDLLLIDEADSMPDSTLKTLLLGSAKRPATTTVLLCLPASVRRFSSVVDSVVVELTRLSQSDTRLYLLERATHAGFADLFAPAALDLIVDASRGLPRSLWSIAGLAYFSAASTGASQISRQHVADALASQITRPEPAEPTPAPAAVSIKRVPEKAPAAAPIADPPRAHTNVAYFAAPNAVPQTRHPVAEAPVPAAHIEPSIPISTPALASETKVISQAPEQAASEEVETRQHDAAAEVPESAEAPYFLPAFDEASEIPGLTADTDLPSVSVEIKEAEAPAEQSARPAPVPAADVEKPALPTHSDAAPLSLLRDGAAEGRNRSRSPVVVLGLAASLAAVAVIPALLLLGKSPSATSGAGAPVASVSVPRQVSVVPPPPTPPAPTQAAASENSPAPAVKPAGSDAAKKSASLSKSQDSNGRRAAATAKPSGPARTPAAAKPANDVKDTKAASAPAQPAAAPFAFAVPVPYQAPAATQAANEPPAQANAAPAPEAATPADPAAEAEARAKAVADEVARIVAAKEQAERQKAADEAAAQTRAEAIRASIARDAANRVNAAMQESRAAEVAAQAAADAKAASDAAAKERSAFQHSLFGVAH